MELIDGMKPWLVLGEIADVDAPWHDYAQLGVSHTDIPALLSVLKDPLYKSADDDSAAIWVPVHAWRALGQVGTAKNSQALIAALELWIDDDWAVAEFPKVLSMLGVDALDELTVCLKNLKVSVYVRSVVADAMMMLAKQSPQSRSTIVCEFMSYLTKPDLSQPLLNGLVISNLVDLDATEAIDLIRHIYDLGCVDQSCAGDIFEIEEALGLPSSYNDYLFDHVEIIDDVMNANDENDEEVATSNIACDDAYTYPSYLPSVNCVDGLCFAEQSTTDLEKTSFYPTSTVDTSEQLAHYLQCYCQASGVQSVAALDGFLSALACSPIILPIDVWFLSLWGQGRPNSDALHDIAYQTIRLNAELIAENLKQGIFNATFASHDSAIVAEQDPEQWCKGFLVAVSLWGKAALAYDVSQHLAVIKLCANGHELWQADTQGLPVSVAEEVSHVALSAKGLERLQHQVLDTIEVSVMQLFELLKGDKTAACGSIFMQERGAQSYGNAGLDGEIKSAFEMCDTTHSYQKRKKHCLN